MLTQLPLRAAVALIAALGLGLVARDAWLGAQICVVALLATGARVHETFATKLQRALLVGVVLAVSHLYLLHALERRTR